MAPSRSPSDVAQVAPTLSRGESRSPRTSWASRASRRSQRHQKLSPLHKVGRPEGFSVRPCRQVWTKSPTQPAHPPCIHLRPNTLLVSPNPATLATRFSPACCRSATMMWKRLAVYDPRHTHAEKAWHPGTAVARHSERSVPTSVSTGNRAFTISVRDAKSKNPSSMSPPPSSRPANRDGHSLTASTHAACP